MGRPRSVHASADSSVFTTMSGLSFGLNIPGNKKKTAAPPRTTTKAFGAFGASLSDDEDEGSGNVRVSAYGDKRKNTSTNSSKAGASSKLASSSSRNGVSSVNADLRAHQALSAKSSLKSSEAVEDTTVYDYDSFYEKKQAVDKARRQADQADAIERKPKYMEKLIASSKQRERDLLLAKERMMQKEREKEGDEFADKEAFVTGAYKKQQEDLRKQEEEELKREEELRKKSQGMASFHRNMLQRTEGDYDMLVAAADSDIKSTAADQAEEVKKLDIARLRAQGIAVNDEGEVVDKRDLLKGGLNVSKKVETFKEQQDKATAAKKAAAYIRPSKEHLESRARQTKLLEQQMEANRKRAREEETKAEQQMVAESKSRKTTQDVSSARERFLARKREREEEEARKKAEAG